MQSPFGNYFGSDLDTKQLDRLFIESDLDKTSVRLERELYDAKWFDYRFMHFVKATYLFAHYYRQEYRRISERRLDIDRAQYLRGFKGEDFMQLTTRQIKAFFKARQMVDGLGIPYDFYIRKAMNWADSRLWKNMPQPSQLYSSDMKEAIEEAWAKELTIRIPKAADGFYSPKVYKNHRWQNAYQEWFCKLIKTRIHLDQALVSYIYENPNISEAYAIKIFGNDQVARAKYMFSQK